MEPSEPLSNSTPCSRKPKANSSRRRNKRSPNGAVSNINDVNASKAIDTHAVKQDATAKSSQVRIHLWLVCKNLRNMIERNMKKYDLINMICTQIAYLFSVRSA